MTVRQRADYMPMINERLSCKIKLVYVWKLQNTNKNTRFISGERKSIKLRACNFTSSLPRVFLPGNDTNDYKLIKIDYSILKVLINEIKWCEKFLD